MADKESNDLSHQPEDTLIRLKGGLCGVDLAKKCSKETVINFKKYCREYVKNITQKGFVEPTLDLPARASDRLRESLDAVIDVRSKSLKVTNNNNPTGLTSNNKTAMVSPVSTSGRAPRRAAMKARAGCFSAFHLPQKLRRPTNFDPKSGLLLPTIPQTPDFVRDVLAVADDSDTEAPAGSSTFTTNRVDPESNNRNSQEIFKIPPAPFVEPPKVERASRARSRRTKASQASVIDPAMELVAEVSRSRRITRSRSKQSRQGPHDPETPAKNTEPVKRSTRNMRSTQSKKLKVSEAGTPSSTFLVEQEQPMEVVHDQEDTLVENKVNVTHILRQKSHPSSRRVPRSTNEEERVATADDRTINGAPGALDMDYQTAEDLAGCPIIRRSRSVPVLFGSDPDLSEIVDDGVLQKRPSNVEDPMTTFNPIASELDEPAKKGSKRTSDEASSLSNPKRSRIGGSPSVVAGSELKIYDTAPRTRSKHRNQMNNVQSSSKSVNKENDRIDIGQMMKAMEKPGRPTPIKPPKLMKKKQDIPKKNGEDPYKKKKDILSQKTEEIKKYREMKEKKAAELRAAAEKEKQLQLEREQKEREERERLAKAEKQRQKEEALMKKKQLNMQKAQEAEERRRKEEELRLARHKELEEEQRRAAEARQRQVEEAERLAALRKVQEKEEEALRLRMEKMAEKEKLRALKAGMLKEYGDPDDIGIADGDAEEADGKPPRRPSPKWAESANRTKQLKVQSYLLPSRVFQFYEIKFESPDLRDIFGSTALLRPRTSSAVWAATPPHLSDS